MTPKWYSYRMTKKTNKDIEELKTLLPINYLTFIDKYIEGYDPLSCVQFAEMSTGDNSEDRNIAERVLEAPASKAYISAIKGLVTSNSIMNLEAADRRITQIASSDPLDVIEIGETYEDKKGSQITQISLKDNLTMAQRAAIKSIKPCEGGLEIKFEDKMKALDMIIRRNGGYTDVIKNEVSGNVHVYAAIADNGRGPTNDKE